MPHQSTAIEQLNLSFNQREDRLLLRVGMANQSEISLWITRRVCKDLWHLLQDSHGQMLEVLKANNQKPKAKKKTLEAIDDLLSEPLPAPKLVSSKSAATPVIKKEEVTLSQPSGYNEAYMANRKPLANTPILVVECVVEDDDEELKKANLSLKASAGEVVKMGLTLELVVALSNMMQLATKEACWDLLMLQNHAVKHLVPNSEVIH